MSKEDYYALAAAVMLAPHFHPFIAGLMAAAFAWVSYRSKDKP